MNNIKWNLYWTCQFFGWGSAALYWSYFQINNTVPLFVGILSVFIPFILAISYTHLYRNLAHRFGWINLSIKSLIPILIVGWICISGIYVSIGLLNSYLIYGVFEFEIFLGMLSGGIRYAAIWLLAFHLYHFAQYRSRYELKQVKGDMLHLEAKYHNLSSELNPHFLFNALNSIKALTLEDPTKSRKAVDLLSDILRNSIQVNRYQKIPLFSEMERVRSYLELEQIRFEERLVFKIDVSETLMNVLLPPMALLNLVENAIKHGIEPNPSPGIINISGVNDQGSLILKVINTGLLGPPNSNGIGIKNTKDRLELLYKNNYSLSLTQFDMDHVIATLKLPIENE